ncbi:hypothetical protein CYMTET_5574 [Cymbomonas tetramitiformis]|uniref:Uncharacterized protein n=1 Tax=Cymbomonas tetramitiformis TaxID=36881 RepID=A0AAE0GZ15_9CHLO|nr:hypothetical protein CYMTET_5574 [Cymbomonas tetramitiformis]
MSDHPFTEFNKEDNNGTLIGNWVEESALQSATGTHRYKSWVPGESAEKSVYATAVGAPEFIPTAPRVLDHADKQDSAEWINHSQDVHRHPEGRTNDLRVHVNGNQTGLRTQIMLNSMAAVASNLPADAPPEKNFTSTKMADFVQHDMSQLSVGKRVMKTIDGEEVTLGDRDHTFLAESGLQHKSRVDRERLGETVRDEQHYVKDTPITCYQQSVDSADYPGQGFVHGSGVGGKNPYGKTCNFTKEMSDHTKLIIDQ